MQHTQPQAQRGMPVNDNSGLEREANRMGAQAMSGVDLSGARVHQASTPVLDALARSRGQDLHLAPGGEQHLPHEAWHTVQQR